MVGENGTGKSAIIDSIRLLLLEDEFGRTPISDTDFHRPFLKEREPVNLIMISGIFSDLSKKELEKTILRAVLQYLSKSEQ